MIPKFIGLFKNKFLNIENIKNNNDYNKLINNYVFKCWSLISIVLITAYIIEIIKGLRSSFYVFIFSIFTLGPLIFCYFKHLSLGKENLDIKYYISVGYIIFYTFVTFTSTSLFAWVYIIPMTSALVVYNDKDILKRIFEVVFILNVFYILSNLFRNDFNFSLILSLKELITCYEIQLACICLSGIFLYYSAVCLATREKILSKLQMDIYIDTLTESYNKKFMLEQIPQIFNESKSYSLAFIDIDNFKRFNDSYSHEFGDIVLKNTCNIIKENIKNLNDTFLIRVGGDEFIIITKIKDYSKFLQVLEDIREKIYFNKLKYQEELVSIHISIGVANSIVDNCDDYLDLYRKADFKLYEAKKNGKNTLKK